MLLYKIFEKVDYGTEFVRLANGEIARGNWRYVFSSDCVAPPGCIIHTTCRASDIEDYNGKPICENDIILDRHEDILYSVQFYNGSFHAISITEDIDDSIDMLLSDLSDDIHGHRIKIMGSSISSLINNPDRVEVFKSDIAQKLNSLDIKKLTKKSILEEIKTYVRDLLV